MQKHPADHMVVYGTGQGLRTIRREAIDITNGVELLVSTADRLMEHVSSKHLSLDDTAAVVFDEADTLFMNPTQRQHIQALLTELRHVTQRRHDTGAAINSKRQAKLEKMQRTITGQDLPNKDNLTHVSLQPIQHLFVSATISREFAQMLLENFKVSGAVDKARSLMQPITECQASHHQPRAQERVKVAPRILVRRCWRLQTT